MTATSAPALTTPRERIKRGLDVVQAARHQGLVTTAQLIAGVGNLAVTLVLIRVLPPGEYAGFVAFVAAYVLLRAVAAGATAAVALDPRLHGRFAPRALGLGVAVGVLVVAASGALASVTGLSVPAVVTLGAVAPGAAAMALARGRLYGEERALGTAATLVAEPLARALVALLLVPLFGATGAVIAVGAAGYLALASALLSARRGPSRPVDVPELTNRGSAAVASAFLLVAVVASQDVVLANRLLPGGEAGTLAAVATLGGAAYFATATIPLVLMPRSARGGRGSMAVAVSLTVALSLAAVAAVAAVPDAWYPLLLGEAYGGVQTLALPYVSAMAALGLAQVLLAQLCAVRRPGVAVGLGALAATVQLLLLLGAQTAGDVVTATVVSCALLLAGAGTATWLTARPVATPAGRLVPAGIDVAVEPPSVSQQALDVAARRRFFSGVPWLLLAAVVTGVTLRLLVTRGIWVDEAISIRQAQQPWLEMIAQLREFDVHPPLYHSVLWLVVHLTGSTSEWVVRLPSLVAGTALIPLFYVMGRDLWDRRTGLVAAWLVAVSPAAVWYAQEARMYAFWMLGTTLVAWAQLRIQRHGRGRLADWSVFTVSSVALMYTQWFTVLPLVVHHLVFAVFAVRQARGGQWGLVRRWSSSVLVSLAAVAPLVPLLLGQIGGVKSVTAGSAAIAGQAGAANSQMAAGNPDAYAVIANAVWALWGYHAASAMVLLGALWPLMLLLAFAALGRGRSRAVVVLGLVALLPPLLLFAIGFERRQFFELRYFTSTVPLLLLLVARLVASWPRGPVTRVVVPVVVAASLMAGLADQQLNHSNPRTYDFRGAAAWIDDRADGDDVLLYAPGFLHDELTYYSAGIPIVQVGTQLPPTPAGGRTVFVLGSFFEREGVSAQVGSALSQLKTSGARLVARHETANVTVWQYEVEGP